MNAHETLFANLLGMTVLAHNPDTRVLVAWDGQRGFRSVCLETGKLLASMTVKRGPVITLAQARKAAEGWSK